MTIFMIIVGFLCGSVWGYSVRAEHCNKYHHVHQDDDKPYGFKG